MTSVLQFLFYSSIKFLIIIQINDTMKYLLKRPLQRDGLNPTQEDPLTDQDSVTLCSKKPKKRARDSGHSPSYATKIRHNQFVDNALETHADRVARERVKRLINMKYEQSGLEAEKKERKSHQKKVLKSITVTKSECGAFRSGELTLYP